MRFNCRHGTGSKKSMSPPTALLTLYLLLQVLENSHAQLLHNSILSATWHSNRHTPDDGLLIRDLEMAMDATQTICLEENYHKNSYLRTFMHKLRKEEQIDAAVTHWVIIFDFTHMLRYQARLLFPTAEGWQHEQLLPTGLQQISFQTADFGRVYTKGTFGIYLPPMKASEECEDKIFYANHLLLDEIEWVQIYFYHPFSRKLGNFGNLPDSSLNLLQVLLSSSTVTGYVLVDEVHIKKPECDCETKFPDFLPKLLLCNEAFSRTYNKVQISKLYKHFYNKFEFFKFSIRKGMLKESKKQMPDKVRDMLESRFQETARDAFIRMAKLLKERYAAGEFQDDPLQPINDIYDAMNTIQKATTLLDKFNILWKLMESYNINTATYHMDYMHKYALLAKYMGRYYSSRMATSGTLQTMYTVVKMLTMHAKCSLPVKDGQNVSQQCAGRTDLRLLCAYDALIVSGKTISTKTLSTLDTASCNGKTLVVISSHNFIIDASIQVTGLNMAVVSPLWTILGHHTIDLSGVDGQPSKTEPMTILGNNRDLNRHYDEPGGDGHHFFGLGMKMVGDGPLRIVSKGGKGGDGRNTPEKIYNSDLVEAVDSACQLNDEVLNMTWSKYGATQGGHGGWEGDVIFQMLEQEDAVRLKTLLKPGADGNPGVPGITKIYCTSGTRTKFRDSEIHRSVRPRAPKAGLDRREMSAIVRRCASISGSAILPEILTHLIKTENEFQVPLTRKIDEFLQMIKLASKHDNLDLMRRTYHAEWLSISRQVQTACHLDDSSKLMVNYITAIMMVKLLDPRSGPTVIGIDSFLGKAVRNLRTLHFEKGKINLYALRELSDGNMQATVTEAVQYVSTVVTPAIDKTVDLVGETISSKLFSLDSSKDFRTAEDVESSHIGISLLLDLKRVLSLYATAVQGLAKVKSSADIRTEGRSRVRQVSTNDVKKNNYMDFINLFRKIHSEVYVNELTALRDYTERIRSTARMNGALFYEECPDCADVIEDLNQGIRSVIKQCSINETTEKYQHVLENECSETGTMSVQERGCEPQGLSHFVTQSQSRIYKALKRFRALRLAFHSKPAQTLTSLAVFFNEMLLNLQFMVETKTDAAAVETDILLFATTDMDEIFDIKQELKKTFMEIYEDIREESFTVLRGARAERLTGEVGIWLDKIRKLNNSVRKILDMLEPKKTYSGLTSRSVRGLVFFEEISKCISKTEEYMALYSQVRNINLNREVEKDISDPELASKLGFLKDALSESLALMYFENANRVFRHKVFPMAWMYADSNMTSKRRSTITYYMKKILKLIKWKADFETKQPDIFITGQFSENINPFYRWSAKELGAGLLQDLLQGKSVVLQSDILMSDFQGHALRGSDFVLRLVGRGPPGSTTRARNQAVIDEALKDAWMNLTHSGMSYLKYGSRVYRFVTPKVTLLHTLASTSSSTDPGQRLFSNSAFNKVHNLGFTLSPFTVWTCHLQGVSWETRSKVLAVQHLVGSVELVGRGTYLHLCREDMPLDEYYTPTMVRTFHHAV